MIGWFTALGLSERVARIVAPLAIAVVVLLAFYLVLDAYGDARYNAGKDHADAAWHAAAEALEAQSRASAADADKPADTRKAAYAAALRLEKEKIDATIAQGGDPLDILF